MCFFYVIFISVFTFNPMFLASGLIGAVLLLFTLDGIKSAKILLVYLLMIVVISITNPLFSHNGATILFFINDSRITLESLIYGINSALMIVGILIWFNCFNKVFDSEKIMYLIGRFFPRLALVFSMSLNFIPRLTAEYRSINSAQKTIRQSRIKRAAAAFSAVITRSMEGAIITSDSMSARGYSLKGRTHFHRFRFTPYDAFYLVLFTALFVLCVVRSVEICYYPYFEMNVNAFGLVSAISFLALAFLPFILEVKEALKWKLYLSRI